MSTLVEWMLYAACWEFAFRNGCGWLSPLQNTAVDVIQEYES